MTLLYINGEHCTSLEQLKGYFSMDITPESDTYFDLLDYGRHGDIAKWIREHGESELSSKVESIAIGLVDSDFYAQLKGIITGMPDSESAFLKPAFDKCFSFENLKCDVKDTEAKVRVSLKVLMSVNEEYVLSVSTNWGRRAMTVNPYSHPEGNSAGFEYTFYKRPGKDFGEIKVMAEGNELARMSNYNRDVDEIVVGDVVFKMIRVEGGSFLMGSLDADAVNEIEKPAHRVTLSDYYIGETLVTQAQWKAVMGDNPSEWKGDSLPVDQVSWEDCQEFIKQLNKNTGKTFRLPTEAEWEYAARGGRKSQGFKYAGSNNIHEVAWHYVTCQESKPTHPVKQKRANELGLYDMSGNVSEWCQDWYGSYNSSSQTNPSGPSSGSCRVLRGGNWVSTFGACRVASRSGHRPDDRYKYFGFRLAL